MTTTDLQTQENKTSFTLLEFQLNGQLTPWLHSSDGYFTNSMINQSPQCDY